MKIKRILAGLLATAISVTSISVSGFAYLFESVVDESGPKNAIWELEFTDDVIEWAPRAERVVSHVTTEEYVNGAFGANTIAAGGWAVSPMFEALEAGEHEFVWNDIGGLETGFDDNERFVGYFKMELWWQNAIKDEEGNDVSPSKVTVEDIAFYDAENNLLAIFGGEEQNPQVKASSSNEGESTVKLEAQFDANVGGIGEWENMPAATFSADGSEVTVTYDFSDYGKVKFADNFVALSTSLPWDYDENPDLYNENNVKLLSIKMDGEEVGDTSLLCLSNEADMGKALRITLLNQWGLNFKNIAPLYGYTDKEFSVFEVTFSVDNPDTSKPDDLKPDVEPEQEFNAWMMYASTCWYPMAMTKETQMEDWGEVTLEWKRFNGNVVKDGTYSVGLGDFIGYGVDEETGDPIQGSVTAEGATILIIEMEELAEQLGIGKGSAAYENLGSGASSHDKMQIAKDAGINITDVTLVQTYNGVETEIPVDDSKIIYGDLEGSGKLRIELYNEYGETRNDKPLDNLGVLFDGSLICNFTITGIDAILNSEEEPDSDPDPDKGDIDHSETSDYTYEILDDGTVEITKYNGSATELEIPSEIDGYTVTRIGYCAFENCTSLTSVIIPDSVTSIGGYAFYFCELLKSVTIPNSVTSIGGYAFEECTSLTSINIPDSVTEIGRKAFSNTAILNNQTGDLKYIGKWLIVADKEVTTADIKTGTVGIAECAFEDCAFLKSVTIPNSVTSIGEGAFRRCTSLTSVDLPNSVARIYVGAFDNCTSLKSVVIPESVVTIGREAFYGCTSLESATVFEGVKYIGVRAFYGCVKLDEFSIPDSVVGIGNEAFYNTALLNNMSEDLKYIDKWLIIADKKITTASVKEGTVGLAEGAFESCKTLTSVTLPDSLEIICGISFYGCNSLKSINIPNKVTSIGWFAFMGCHSLNTIIIPKSVEEIEFYAIGFTDFDGVLGRDSNFKIYCYKNTAGEKYAVDNEIDYELLDIDNMSGFKASSRTDTTVTLGWKKNTSAAGYIIQQYKDNKWVDIATIDKNSTVSYKVTGLTASTRYVFRIQGYKDINGTAIKGEFTDKLVVYTNPKKISGFKASAKTDSTITLSWAKNTTATGYILEQYKGNKWVRIAKITDNATTTYKVSKLTAVTRYPFRIQAYKEIGKGAVKSAYTNKLVVYTNPSKVTTFKAKSKNDTTITLSWAKNSTATGYILEQYKGNKWVRIAKLTSNATTTYKVTGLSASTRYAFRIQAYKNIGSGAVKSAYTNKLVVYTNPKAMTGFKASAKTKDSITLSWDKNTTATGYIVEQYKSGKWVRIAKLTSNSSTKVKITGLKANTRYVFRIQAYKNIPNNGAVKSAYTSKLAVYTAK